MKIKIYLVYLILFVALVVTVLLTFPKTAKEAGIPIVGDLNSPQIAPQSTQTVKKGDSSHIDILAQIRANFGSNSVRYEHIFACESNLRQFNPDGTVLRGVVNHNDIGIAQINSVIWGETAEKLGYDIFTVTGNLKMAKYISEVQPNAWYLSENCWSVDKS